MALGKKSAKRVAAALAARIGKINALHLMEVILPLSKNRNYQKNMRRIHKALKKYKAKANSSVSVVRSKIVS